MKPRPQKNRKTSPTKTTTTPSRRDQILADFATLRIPVTADQLDAALKHAQDTGLSHLDFLHRLLADQAGLRRERSLQRRIKDAGLGDLKPLSEFDWNFNPAISRTQIEALVQADFVRRGQNLVFVGQSGLGKSRLIRNIGFAACTWYKVKYVTSGELLEDLTAALADQTIHDRIRFYARFDLLIIDEFGLDRIERSLCPQAASLWYKIIDARQQAAHGPDYQHRLRSLGRVSRRRAARYGVVGSRCRWSDDREVERQILPSTSQHAQVSSKVNSPDPHLPPSLTSPGNSPGPLLTPRKWPSF